MSTILHTLRVVTLAVAVTPSFLAASSSPAQEPADPAPPSGVREVARSAEERLATSIQELNAIRLRVAEEKIPLAQQLTGLEERAIALRKDNDRITRLVDVGALEIAQIKLEMKARQDELGYVGNILDEYVRKFESKINPTELQYCGASIEAAKQAIENNALTTQERFDQQASFVDGSIARIRDAFGGMRFSGVAVDMLGTVSQGQFAMIGPVALFRATTGASGLAVPQLGSSNPIVHPLEGELENTISTLIANGEGTLPLDPSRGGALKALVQRTNLVHVFLKGGPIMWPILATSIIALTVVLERVFFLLNDRRKRDRRSRWRGFDCGRHASSRRIRWR